MGLSTPTTAFDGAILLLCLCNVYTLNICMKDFGLEKNIFLQDDSYENLDYFSVLSFDI